MADKMIEPHYSDEDIYHAKKSFIRLKSAIILASMSLLSFLAAYVLTLIVPTTVTLPGGAIFVTVIFLLGICSAALLIIAYVRSGLWDVLGASNFENNLFRLLKIKKAVGDRWNDTKENTDA